MARFKKMVKLSEVWIGDKFINVVPGIFEGTVLSRNEVSTGMFSFALYIDGNPRTVAVHTPPLAGNLTIEVSRDSLTVVDPQVGQGTAGGFNEYENAPRGPHGLGWIGGRSPVQGGQPGFHGRRGGRGR